MREAEMVCSGASAIPPDGDRAVGPTAMMRLQHSSVQILTGSSASLRPT
jgi:hypothetical protein